MKRLNRWIAAFFFGQILALWHKDRSFKSKLQSATGRQKVKVLFEGLFNFNKRLVVDAKNTDVQANFRELRDFIISEKDRLTDEIAELKESLPTLAHDKATEVFAWLNEQADELKQRLIDFTHEIDEKYHLTTLVEKLKEDIKELSSGVEKTIDKKTSK